MTTTRVQQALELVQAEAAQILQSEKGARAFTRAERLIAIARALQEMADEGPERKPHVFPHVYTRLAGELPGTWWIDNGYGKHEDGPFRTREEAELSLRDGVSKPENRVAEVSGEQTIVLCSCGKLMPAGGGIHSAPIHPMCDFGVNPSKSDTPHLSSHATDLIDDPIDLSESEGPQTSAPAGTNGPTILTRAVAEARFAHGTTELTGDTIINARAIVGLGHPTDEGEALADALLARADLDWSHLVIDVTKCRPQLLISPFFNQFFMRIGARRIRTIRWLTEFEFQRSTIAHLTQAFAATFVGTDPGLAELYGGRIQKTPGVCDGEACIRDTRITVWELIKLICEMEGPGVAATDADADAHWLTGILAAYPRLDAEDVAAARAYHADNRDEIHRAIEKDEEIPF